MYLTKFPQSSLCPFLNAPELPVGGGAQLAAYQEREGGTGRG